MMIVPGCGTVSQESLTVPFQMTPMRYPTQRAPGQHAVPVRPFWLFAGLLALVCGFPQDLSAQATSGKAGPKSGAAKGKAGQPNPYPPGMMPSGSPGMMPGMMPGAGGRNFPGMMPGATGRKKGSKKETKPGSRESTTAAEDVDITELPKGYTPPPLPPTG